MASLTRDGNRSWLSLCMAATSKLMDERMMQGRAVVTDDDDSAVTKLLSSGGQAHLSLHQQKKGTKRRKKSLRQIEKKPIKKMKFIGGVTAVSKRDTAWNTMFRRLQEFKMEYGHCNVPQGHTSDPELATWVKNQRQAYRYMLEKKRTKRISPDRVTRLNHIGFEWRKYNEWKPGSKKPKSRPSHSSCLKRQNFA